MLDINEFVINYGCPDPAASLAQHLMGYGNSAFNELEGLPGIEAVL